MEHHWKIVIFGYGCYWTAYEGDDERKAFEQVREHDGLSTTNYIQIWKDGKWDQDIKNGSWYRADWQALF